MQNLLSEYTPFKTFLQPGHFSHFSGLDFYFRVFVLIRNSRSWAPSALELEQDVMTTVENYWTQEISGSDWFDRVELRSTGS